MRADKELKSLQLVKELLNQLVTGCTITESADQYAHYDLLLENSNKNRAYIEVKERMGKYVELNSFIKYSELGWMSEQTKWDFLVGKPSRYINLFRVCGEVIIIVWDLNNIKNNAVTLNCPRATDESFGKIGNRDKLSTNLLAKQGTVYIKRSNEFKSIDWNDLKNELYSKNTSNCL